MGNTKQWTWILGIVLTVVGIWGYLLQPGQFVLGVFEVDGPHNLFHLLSGIIGILAALGGEKRAKMYLQVFGVIYAIVFLLGMFQDKVLGIIMVNFADGILHLVIAALALYGGFGKAKGSSMSTSASAI